MHRSGLILAMAFAALMSRQAFSADSGAIDVEFDRPVRVKGDISISSEVNTFRFPGAAGRPLSFELRAAPGRLSPRLLLTAADGTTELLAPLRPRTSAIRTEFTASAAGSIRADVLGDGSTTGSYVLRVRWGSAKSSDVSASADVRRARNSVRDRRIVTRIVDGAPVRIDAPPLAEAQFVPTDISGSTVELAADTVAFPASLTMRSDTDLNVGASTRRPISSAVSLTLNPRVELRKPVTIALRVDVGAVRRARGKIKVLVRSEIDGSVSEVDSIPDFDDVAGLVSFPAAHFSTYQVFAEDTTLSTFVRLDDRLYPSQHPRSMCFRADGSMLIGSEAGFGLDSEFPRESRNWTLDQFADYINTHGNVGIQGVFLVPPGSSVADRFAGGGTRRDEGAPRLEYLFRGPPAAVLTDAKDSVIVVDYFGDVIRIGMDDRISYLSPELDDAQRQSRLYVAEDATLDATGRLIYGNASGLYRLDTSDGTRVRLGSDNNIAAVCVDSSGRVVYACGIESAVVKRIDPATASVEEIAGGQSRGADRGPRLLAVTGDGGHLASVRLDLPEDVLVSPDDDDVILVSDRGTGIVWSLDHRRDHATIIAGRRLTWKQLQIESYERVLDTPYRSNRALHVVHGLAFNSDRLLLAEDFAVTVLASEAVPAAK